MFIRSCEVFTVKSSLVEVFGAEYHRFHMRSMTFEMQKKHVGRKRYVTLTFDADRFERLAEVFGLYNPDFLESLDRAEANIRAGQLRKIKSFKDLR